MMLRPPARTSWIGLSSSFSISSGGISMNSLASAKTCPMRTPTNSSPSPYSPSPSLKYRRYFSRCSGERCVSNRSTNRSSLSFSGILDLPLPQRTSLFRRSLLQDAKPEVRHPASNDQCSRHHITDSTIACRILIPLPRHSSSNGHLALQQHSAPIPTPYSPNLVEGEFCELLRHYGGLGSSLMRRSALR